MGKQKLLFEAIDAIEIHVDDPDENAPDLLTKEMEERFRTTSKDSGDRKILFLCKHGSKIEYYAVRLYYVVPEDPTTEVSLTFIIRSCDAYLMGFQRRNEVWEFKWTDEATQRVLAASKNLNVHGEYYMEMSGTEPKLCGLQAREYLFHLYHNKELDGNKSLAGAMAFFVAFISEALRFIPIRQMAEEGWESEPIDVTSFRRKPKISGLINDWEDISKCAYKGESDVRIQHLAVGKLPKDEICCLDKMSTKPVQKKKKKKDVRQK